MSLDNIKSTVLDEAKARANKLLAEAGQEAERILSEGRTIAERGQEETTRDAKHRFERETNRELERLQHENRLHILSAKNKAIDEVFKRVRDKIASLSDDEVVAMVGKWLGDLPDNVGGVLKVNPADVDRFSSRLDKLNKNRSGDGKFTSVAGDAKVLSGAVVDGPDYDIDCTFERRLGELRESSVGELARVLFGA